ncbi:hypothetical protein [Adhaeribacter soli]|uniref:Uncharacterized protein n=1 Tax=Adhaeribacter soli TaxID=2607655 RepID=A0A5N1J0V5_9BACT|nr:hypothetical protein [Adhaeribacter soli]KAA9340270.1 hypothetical protein F0P94_07950 [Adhaeribacter soli]
MTTTQVNYLNVGLMLVSCALAFLLPFELFLFSYAILGPLHYLTEINWLHKRNYFTKGKNDYMLLLALCFLVVFSFYFKIALGWFLPTDSQGQVIVSPQVKAIADAADQLTPTFVLAAFGAGLIMILVQSRKMKLISYGLLLGLCFLLREDKTYLVPFAAFLPTLGHVFLFTGAFILVGALKSRSFSGILSLAIFIACALSFFFFIPETAGYAVNEDLRYKYNVSFLTLNFGLMEIFQPTATANARTTDQLLSLLYESQFGILITRFLAFAYTYHYLNWFSKTSVIKWHQVPKKQLLLVTVLWLTSIGLFFYDYKVGFIVLYLLSMLHVLLEFPLNFQSFRQIGEEVKLRFQPMRVNS